MKNSLNWPKILLITGFIAMLIGIIDPLEGSVVILAGSFLLAISAFLGKSKHSLIIYLSFALIAVGVGLLFGLSAMGGVGDNTGRSNWWLLVVLPYPVGWILGIVGTVMMMRQRSKKSETVNGER
jgi:phosphotransferase system  glucose/maltose/N-acetylglucosamine-specific IIC component